jgi:DNA-binding beta-propeller fold protein YncE
MSRGVLIILRRCSRAAPVCRCPGNGTVEVLDIRKGERSAEIKGLNEPQGVYYSSQNGELYVASGGDGTLRIYDGNSLKLRQTLEFGEDADNVRYDGRSRQILVGFGNGRLGIVDASGQKVGTIPLSSHPESFQLEEEGSRIFVNVPKESAVAVVARTKHAKTAIAAATAGNSIGIIAGRPWFPNTTYM